MSFSQAYVSLPFSVFINNGESTEKRESSKSFLKSTSKKKVTLHFNINFLLIDI